MKYAKVNEDAGSGEMHKLYSARGEESLRVYIDFSYGQQRR